MALLGKRSLDHRRSRAGLSRSAALQPQNFAAPLINDRFSRGIAAVLGCVLRPKGGLCKGHLLRFVAIGEGRSIRSGSLKPLSVRFRETDLQISQMQR